MIFFFFFFAENFLFIYLKPSGMKQYLIRWFFSAQTDDDILGPKLLKDHNAI